MFFSCAPRGKVLAEGHELQQLRNDTRTASVCDTPGALSVVACGRA